MLKSQFLPPDQGEQSRQSGMVHPDGRHMRPFVEVLAHWMEHCDIPIHAVSHIARIKKKRVKAWLAGTDWPNRREFQNLKSAYPGFAYAYLPSEEEMALARSKKAEEPQAEEPQQETIFEDADETLEELMEDAVAEAAPFHVMLRDVRKTHGDSVSALADLLEVGKTTIGRIETGGSVHSKVYIKLLDLYPELRLAQVPRIYGNKSDGGESNDVATPVLEVQAAAQEDISSRPTLTDAIQFLQMMMREGRGIVLASDISDGAAKLFISQATLNEAKKRLGIESVRTGHGGHASPWGWISWEDVEDPPRIPVPKFAVLRREALLRFQQEVAQFGDYDIKPPSDEELPALLAVEEDDEVPQTPVSQELPVISDVSAPAWSNDLVPLDTIKAFIAATIGHSPIKLPFPKNEPPKRAIRSECLNYLYQSYRNALAIPHARSSVAWLANWLVSECVQQKLVKTVAWPGIGDMLFVVTPHLVANEVCVFVLSTEGCRMPRTLGTQETIHRCYIVSASKPLLDCVQDLAKLYNELAPDPNPAPQVIVTSGRARPTTIAEVIRPRAAIDTEPLPTEIDKVASLVAEKYTQVKLARDTLRQREEALREAERACEIAEANAQRVVDHMKTIAGAQS